MRAAMGWSSCWSAARLWAGAKASPLRVATGGGASLRLGKPPPPLASPPPIDGARTPEAAKKNGRSPVVRVVCGLGNNDANPRPGDQPFNCKLRLFSTRCNILRGFFTRTFGSIATGMAVPAALRSGWRHTRGWRPDARGVGSRLRAMIGWNSAGGCLCRCGG